MDLDLDDHRHYCHDKQVCVLSGLAPELIQSSKSIQFLTDNRVVICCSEVILIMEIYMDQSSEATNKSDPLIVNLQRTICLSDLPSFNAADGIINFYSTLTSLSREMTQILITDPSLCKDTFYPRVDFGGFRSVGSSPYCSVNGILLSVVTFDHTSFIFEEKEGKWSVLVSLNQLIKDLLLSGRKLPMVVEEDISFDQYKDLIYGMLYVDIAWSSVFQTSDDDSEIGMESVLLFCGMKNGDIQIWQVQLPLSDTGDFTHLKTEKCLSEISALLYHPISKHTGYLCIGSMNGNVRILFVNLQGTVSLKQAFYDCFEDSVSVQDFDSVIIDNSHILIAAKQYFLLLYLLQDNEIALLKTVRLDCSLPIGSISAEGNSLCASSEDGWIFEYVVTLQDQSILVELEHRRKGINIICKTKASSVCCKGFSLSTNGAISIGAYRPSNHYVQSIVKTKWRDWQKVVLSLPRVFSVDSLIEKLVQRPSPHINIQDASIRLCLHFQHKIKMQQFKEQDKAIIEKLLNSDETQLLQLARSLVYHMKFNVLINPDEQDCLGLDESFDYRKIEKKILLRHVSMCLQMVNTEKREDKVVHYVSAMLKWMKHFGNKTTDIIKKAKMDKLQNLYNDKKFTMKCCMCQDDFKSFDGPLCFVCVKGHKTKLSCLTLNPVYGLNITKCISCGSNAESKMCLSPVMFLKDKTHCPLCGGHLR